MYLNDTSEQFFLMNVILAGFGLIFTFLSKQKALGIAQATAWGIYLVVFHSLANIPLNNALAKAVSDRFAMQPNVLVAIWMGVGFTSVSSFFQRKGNIFLIAWKLLLLALLGIKIQSNFRILNHRHDGHLLSSYGKSILETLPKNSLVLSHTDINWNTLRYLQACEKQQPNVTLLSLQVMPFPWFIRQHKLYSKVYFPRVFTKSVSTIPTKKGYTIFLTRFLHANLDRFDHIYLDLHGIDEAQLKHGGEYHGYILTPIGLLWEVHTLKKPPTFSTWQIKSEEAFKVRRAKKKKCKYQTLAIDTCYFFSFYDTNCRLILYCN
jgi:hypothetical protein